jgi:ketosteroid isomerase-like protein
MQSQPAATAVPVNEQEILDLEHEFFAALRVHDTETVDRLLSEEFVLTDPGDTCLTKSQWVEFMSSERLRFQSVVIDKLRVQMMGDIAAVHGQLAVTSHYDAPAKQTDYNGRFRYTNIYQRRGGRWEMILAAGNRLS